MFALFNAGDRKPFSQEDLPVISVEVKTSSRIIPYLKVIVYFRFFHKPFNNIIS